jgi:hypothetical protein
VLVQLLFMQQLSLHNAIVLCVAGACRLDTTLLAVTSAAAAMQLLAAALSADQLCAPINRRASEAAASCAAHSLCGMLSR